MGLCSKPRSDSWDLEIAVSDSSVRVWRRASLGEGQGYLEMQKEHSEKRADQANKSSNHAGGGQEVSAPAPHLRPRAMVVRQSRRRASRDPAPVLMSCLWIRINLKSKSQYQPS